MRFLFDHNLPPSLKRTFPGSLHVTDVGLESADDEVVWEYARDNDFTLMTKDSDFQHLSARFGPPPKVIWLRVGNVRTADLLTFINSFDVEIREFAADPIVGLLVLSR